MFPRRSPPIDPRTHGNKDQRHGVRNGARSYGCGLMNSGAGCEIVSEPGSAPETPGKSPKFADSHILRMELTIDCRLTRSKKGARCFLGFHFGAASAQDVRGILPGFPLVVITICGQKIDDMAEFMEKRE